MRDGIFVFAFFLRAEGGGRGAGGCQRSLFSVAGVSPRRVEFIVEFRHLCLCDSCMGWKGPEGVSQSSGPERRQDVKGSKQ